jgi:GNAT superfamily N-acetyltransferase
MFPSPLTSQRLTLTYVPDVPTWELTSHGRCGVYHLTLQGQYVGAVSLTGICDSHCEIGYEVERVYRGQGIASEAVGAVVAHLDIAMVSAQARSDNVASRRVLEKAGFSLASSKLVWSYGEDAPMQIMAYRMLPNGGSAGARHHG